MAHPRKIALYHENATASLYRGGGIFEAFPFESQKAFNTDRHDVPDKAFSVRVVAGASFVSASFSNPDLAEDSGFSA
ncbi:hypothetical protein JCM17845_17580 [Iodidimonas gelatinilytica]|uniref:Uncharacterized protein n=1 Tax=Iodidimonas gelatinilytica TaxID=1236966 RepID=A0A5A7N0C5_9PROT|nr:hypothetical protein JCM17845_17580 [Iodidimonas gelatinilytica]